MQGGHGARPSSSFGRPSTSRPGTSFGQAYHPQGFLPNTGPAYEVEEVYEEESEDEDVFAFLPPSTADQQREREREQQEQQGILGQGQPQGQAPYYYPQLLNQNPFAHNPATPSLPATPFRALDSSGNSYANYAFAALQYADRAPSQPQPIVNSSITEAETGSSNPFVSAQPKQVQGPSGYLQPPPLSPPSTDSQPSTGYGAAGQDGYKLRRMSKSVPDSDKAKEGAGIKSRPGVVKEEVETPATRSNTGSPVQGVGKGSADERKSTEKCRKSREHNAETGAVPTELDLGVDLEICMDRDITNQDVNQKSSRERRKKRSAKHRTAGPSGAGSSPAGGTSEGLRRRLKNVNASPYYTYAQFTNARNGRGKLLSIIFIVFT